MPPGIKSPISNPNQVPVQPRREHRSFEVPDVTSGPHHESQQSYGPPPSYGEYQNSSASPDMNPHRAEYERQRRQEEAQAQSENTARLEAEVASLRRQKVTGNIPISSFGRERWEYLSNLGRIRKDVVVDGTTFSLQTLKAREMREAVKAVTNVPRLEVLFESRRQELAYAIYRVDGAPIEQVLGSDDFNVRLQFIEDLDHAVQKYLHAELGSIDKQASDKYAIKTEAQLKEVIEDAKKS